VKIISLNVGLPRLMLRGDEPISTGIFKEPVAGRKRLRKLNLEGDRQADLSVHGGPSKAVYVYPTEHYDFWKRDLPEMHLPWGMFGENFSTEGLSESEVSIGDRFRVGSATVIVTEPRMPCHKLALRFGRSDIIKRFLQSERSGFYLAVLHEGEVGAGDQFELIAKDPHGVRVRDITRLYVRDKGNVELLRRAIEVEALPESWKARFTDRLEKLDHGQRQN
jgi:MOSC domain-containing protein YiiM